MPRALRTRPAAPSNPVCLPPGRGGRPRRSPPSGLGERPVFGARGPILVVLLAGGTLVRCDCEEARTFEAGGRYEPQAINFGPVYIGDQARRTITVTSQGSLGLRIEGFSLDQDQNFSVEVSPDLLQGLAVDGTSTITVTFEPCPVFRANPTPENRQSCPTQEISATLTVNDNTERQTLPISITGQPAQDPVASFACAIRPSSSVDICNMPGLDLEERCENLLFGSVPDLTAGRDFCDLFIQVTNSYRMGAPVAPLLIEDARVEVQEASLIGSGPIRDGEDVGFLVLSAEDDPTTGEPLPLELPFSVEIPEGSMEASELLRVRFTGRTAGTWVGQTDSGLGLRLSTNDPDLPLKTFFVSGTSQIPDIEVLPSNIVNFGSVAQGASETRTVRVRNEGNLDLEIQNAGLVMPNSDFRFETSDSLPLENRTLAPFSEVALSITYSPSQEGQVRAFYEIRSNDPDERIFQLELRGGPIPQICPPPGQLDFGLPAGDGQDRVEDLVLTSCGTGNLRITGFRVQSSVNEQSADDFRVDRPECAGVAPGETCMTSIELCPRDNPLCEAGLGTSITVPVIYSNNDISQTDRAELVVLTDDPTLPEFVVNLAAQDNPCFPPDPRIEFLMPDNACVGSPVTMRIEGPPGGPIGTSTVTTLVECNYSITFGRASAIGPNASPEACGEARFTPMAGPVITLEATVRNSCGRSATTPVAEILVSTECQ